MKVKIKTVVTTRNYNDKQTGQPKPIYTITLEDGRVGDAFGDWSGMDGKEADITIEEKEYNNKKTLLFKKAQEQKGFPKKDWEFEKKRVALECSVRSYAGGRPTNEIILKTAETFLTFLR